MIFIRRDELKINEPQKGFQMKNEILLLGVMIFLGGMGMPNNLQAEESLPAVATLQSIPAKISPMFLENLARIVEANKIGKLDPNASLTDPVAVGEILHFHVLEVIQQGQYQKKSYLDSVVVLIKGKIDGTEGLLVYELTPERQIFSWFAILKGSSEVLKLENAPESNLNHLIKKIRDEAQILLEATPKQSI